MPVQIIHERGKLIPVVFCDVCDERILDAAKANYYWEPINGTTERRNIVFACCNCDRRVDCITGDFKHMAYEPLESFPLFLGRNMGMKITAKNRQRIGFTEALARMGLEM